MQYQQRMTDTQEVWVPEVIFEDARQHEHLNIHSFEHIAAAGHACTVCSCRQLRHGQIRAVAVVVAHNDGACFSCPAVNDVACAGVGLKAGTLQHTHTHTAKLAQLVSGLRLCTDGTTMHWKACKGKTCAATTTASCAVCLLAPLSEPCIFPRSRLVCSNV